MRHALTVAALCGALTLPSPAQAADNDGVGLGVAAGLSYAPTKINNQAAGAAFAWGFFVDIPLLETFYITPAAMLYQLDLGNPGGSEPVTDIDLNFKFIVPIGSIRLGLAATGGLSAVERTYRFHYGAAGFFSLNLVSNFDLFLLAQYKRLVREGREIDNLHIFAGGMYHF